jgi:hypothetical protein
MSATPATRERPYGIPPPACRLPDGTHVGAAHLQITDPRSLAYYDQVPGLRAHSVAGSSAVPQRRRATIGHW